MRVTILASAPEYSLTDLDIDGAVTVEDLRRCILQRLALPHEPRSLRLLHSGQLMQPDRPLREYQVQDGSTVHMVLRPGTGATPPVSDPAPPAPNAPPPAVNQMAQQLQAVLNSALNNPGLQSIVQGVVTAATAVATPSDTAPQPPPPSAPAPLTAVAHIHLHCTLQEVDQVPRRIHELRQRLGTGVPLHTDVEHFEVHAGTPVPPSQAPPQPTQTATPPPTQTPPTTDFGALTRWVRQTLQEALSAVTADGQPATRLAPVEAMLEAMQHNEPLRRASRTDLRTVASEMRNLLRHKVPELRRVVQETANVNDMQWMLTFSSYGARIAGLVVDRASRWFVHGMDDLLAFLAQYPPFANSLREVCPGGTVTPEWLASQLRMIECLRGGSAAGGESEEGLFADSDDDGAVAQLDDLANELLQQ